MTNERNELVFQANYALNVEKVVERFNRRMDRFLSLALLLLGSSVAASIGNQVVWGVAVALISSLQFVYRYGEHAGIADDQMRSYQNLVRDIEVRKLSDDAIRDRLEELSESDSKTASFMEQIAHRNTLIRRGQIDKCHDFNWYLTVLAFLFGGTPLPKKSRQEHGGEAQAAHDETPA
ncbi:hypothetical protein [Cobetia marina]|uniref:hypothetical protein n=1 Tax=Cobetia marina TaxID=28258 RepID=UPI003857F06C